jgi:hypothetical protein
LFLFLGEFDVGQVDGTWVEFLSVSLRCLFGALQMAII